VVDLIGSEAAEPQAVLGKTPNLAARLQAFAEPDAVVIAEDTRRLIGGLFDDDDLGTVMLKGFDAPVRAWRLLREGKAESRFEAFHVAAAHAVGWARGGARAAGAPLAACQVGVALLAGEPGIGKSRLIAALQERIEGEPHTRLRYFCSPHHQDSALYPFIAQLQRTVEFEREDTPQHRLNKLQAGLSPALPSDEDIAILAELLSIPTGERYLPIALTPAKEREVLRRPVSAA